MLDSKIKAPAFTSGLPWINTSEPLTLDLLKGKIVLLDFWTFCCSDCMHILPYLAKLEKEFGEFLVVIGVHTGKFDNEGSAENIKRAVLRYGIEHPVVCDRGYSMWEKYFVREWPTLILIDPEGNIVERIACSKKPYGKFEEPIRALIAEYDDILNLQPISQIQIEAEPDNRTLRFPGKILADEKLGRIFIADTGHNRVLVCDFSSIDESNQERQELTITDVIGCGSAGALDGNFDEAQLRAPQGLCIYENDLLIADTENHLIRRANLSNRTLSTIAGNGKQWLYEAESSNVSSTGVWKSSGVALSSPWDMLEKDGKVYIAMAGSHQLWCLTPLQDKIEIYAGTGRESLVDGQRQLSQLSQPSGLALNGSMLFFVDSETSSVRCVDTSTDELRTLIGEGLFTFGDKDGEFKEARLQHPLGIACYKDKLLLADSYNHKIKILDENEQVITTLSGNGKPADSMEPVQYSEPGGISVSGKFAFIADTNNHRIVRLDLESKVASLIELKMETKLHSRPAMPNLHIVEVDNCSARPGEHVSIKFDLNVQASFHLNEEIEIELWLLDGQGIELPEGTRCKIKNITDTLTARIKSASGEINKLGLVTYYCADGENSACFVKSFLFEIRIDNAEPTTVKPIILPVSIP